MNKRILFFCSIALFLSSCSSLPYREQTYRDIRRADAVLFQAQKLESPVYAPETYLEALLTLRRAKNMMSSENYDEARSLAQKAENIGEQACEESREERMRVKALAERLLYRGEEIWDQYEKGKEKEYAPDALIEIKKYLENGHRLLDDGRYMDALESVQKSHQRLAMLPEAIEKGKVSLLEEEKKRISSQQTAEEILAAARKQAAGIINDAHKQADKIKLEAQVGAAKARQEEFERMYPSTYKVKRGETLNDIAKRREIFNDQFMWPLIYKANRDQIRDPKVVYPGQILSIPRDISFEEIIEARKQAEAFPPFIPPYDAYNPEFYRRYFLLAPVAKSPDAEEVPEEEKSE